MSLDGKRRLAAAWPRSVQFVLGVCLSHSGLLFIQDVSEGVGWIFRLALVFSFATTTRMSDVQRF
jgi:hypothetical protein